MGRSFSCVKQWQGVDGLPEMPHGKCSDQAQAQLVLDLLIIDVHPEENLIPSGLTAPSVPPNWRSHETLTGHLTLSIRFLI